MSTAALVHRLAPLRWSWGAAAFAAAAMILVGAGAVAWLPVVGVFALAAVLSARLQTSALVLIGVALLVDNPGERPMEGRWESPLFAAGQLVYENLHHHTGIGALRFSLLELAIGGLIVLSVARSLRGDDIDDPYGHGHVVASLRQATLVCLGTVAALEVWGLLRGGDFKNSLWQARQLFWLPMLTLLAGRAFKTDGARIALLRVIVGAAWVRSVIGIYFTYAIARPAGWSLEYTMTHSDAILGVVAILVTAAALVERPTRDHVLTNLLVQPVLLMGLYVNDRRIAMVSLAFGVVAFVLMGPAWWRIWVRRLVILAIPLGLAYLAVGWNSSARVFAPVATVRAILTSEDTSSQTRDIENYNLIQTLKPRPIAGSGFGHEYHEVVQAYRVDHLFAQYKFIAHNSVLWLLSLSGWIFFTGLWALFVTAVSVALWTHRRSTAPCDRVLTFGLVAATISLLMQAWGDMGLQSWMGMLVWSSLAGSTAALATTRTSGVSSC